MRRYPVVVWVGIVFSLALSASALYWDESRVSFSAGSEWATGEQLQDEYREAQARLDLPKGATWPAAAPFPAADADGIRCSYGAGIGAEWAEWRWFDAWAECAVSTSEATATRSSAIDRLPEFFETSAFKTTAEPEYFIGIITRARDGDLTGLQEYVDSVASALEAQE